MDIWKLLLSICVMILGLSWIAPVILMGQIIEPNLHHLRDEGDPYRWSDFPPVADGDLLELSFESQANDVQWTLWIRQYAMRGRPWIEINGERVDRLSNDLRDLTLAIPVPPGTLVDGTNTLRIEAGGRPPNDMFIGEIRLVDRPVDQVLHETTVTVTVTDADSGESIPGRLSVVDHQGSLVSVGGESDNNLAFRRGTVYTLNGEARFGLPSGRYTVYAGRGPEYSLDYAEIDLRPGDEAELELAIRRQVDHTGYISIDQHVHTWDVSSSPTERMITIAGEALQMAIMSEHNLHIDWSDEAKRIGANRLFTLVAGNEVTTTETGLGHFNIYPVDPEASEPDHTLPTWTQLFDAIWDVPGVRMVSLNHPRDVRPGLLPAPLGPADFNAASGRRLDGRPVGFNAIEVINSGSTHTDPLQYVRDWLAMLNRGHRIVPVGGSDSHDVTRKFVGQARTYVAGDVRDPGNIDVEAVMDNFVDGRVLSVSMGLLTSISVDGHEPGEMVSADGPVQVHVKVQGPHWVTADQVLLYANGNLIRRAVVDPVVATDEHKWAGTWEFDPGGQDVHLVAVALGPGIKTAWWKVPRPFDPESIYWQTYVMGVTGAVYVDADSDGQWKSPHEHARKLIEDHGHNLRSLFSALKEWDQATAIQVACLLEESGMRPDSPELKQALEHAAQQVRTGFHIFEAAWRDSQVSQAGS